jgi:nickel transport protein
MAAPAWAHRLSVFAYAEGAVIHVESKFGGGRPCQACEVLVTAAPGGERLLSGQTDEQGRAQLELAEKPKAETVVTVSAGGGHQGAWTLAVADFANFATKPAPKAAPAPVPAALEPVGGTRQGAQPSTLSAPAAQALAAPSDLGAAGAPAAPVDEALLRKLVAEELEKKIAPLRAMLLESKLAGPSMVEIAGGIGYILGLAGLAVLLKSRKK